MEIPPLKPLGVKPRGNFPPLPPKRGKIFLKISPQRRGPPLGVKYVPKKAFGGFTPIFSAKSQAQPKGVFGKIPLGEIPPPWDWGFTPQKTFNPPKWGLGALFFLGEKGGLAPHFKKVLNGFGFWRF